MLKIIYDELKQYCTNKTYSMELSKLSNIYSKFEVGKNYFFIIYDSVNEYIKAICWLDKYDYNIYNQNLFNFSGHIYAKYQGVGVKIQFYEIEPNFNSDKFIQILLNIFNNCHNNEFIKTSKSHILQVCDKTIGKIFVEYVRLNNIDNINNLTIYPSPFVLYENNDFCYYFYK